MTPRDAEIARYVALYRDHGRQYKPTPKRLDLFRALVAERPDLRWLLDVGAGQGAMTDLASAMGRKAIGVEVVPALCRAHGHVCAPAWALPFPDRAFGTVACFDVLEHLLPEDVGPSLREIARVASARILVEVSCRASNWRDAHGQLHMTIWTPAEWIAAAADAWPGWTIRVRDDRPIEDGALVLEALPT